MFSDFLNDENLHRGLYELSKRGVIIIRREPECGSNSNYIFRRFDTGGLELRSDTFFRLLNLDRSKLDGNDVTAMGKYLHHLQQWVLQTDQDYIFKFNLDRIQKTNPPLSDFFNCNFPNKKNI